MNFKCWLVTSSDTEEVLEACLTEEDANKIASDLKNNSDYHVAVEEVTLTSEQVLEYINDAINNEYELDMDEKEIKKSKIGDILIAIGKFFIILSIIYYIIGIVYVIKYYEFTFTELSVSSVILLISIPFSILPGILLIAVGSYLNFTYDKCLTLKEINVNIQNNLNDINIK